MNKLQLVSHALFIIGIFIAVIAFLISKSEKIAWVGELMSPRYSAAKPALAKIDRNEILNQNDEGFDEIEKIVKEHLVKVPANQGKEEIIQEAELIKLGHPMGKSIIGAGINAQYLGVLMRHGGKDINFDDLDYEVIRKRVNALQQDKIFRGETWVLAIGLLMAVISKIIDILISE